MKIYEASCRFVPIARQNMIPKNPILKFFYDKRIEKEEAIDVYVHAFLYDHEDPIKTAKNLLFESLVKDFSGLNFKEFQYAPTNINLKEISINDVRVVLVPDIDQWIRYTRLMKHPDFDWDKYVTLEDDLSFVKGDEIVFLTSDSFNYRNFDYMKFTCGEIKYHFSAREKGIRPIDKDISSSRLRYNVIDPIFNNAEEELRFLKDGKESI